MRLSAKVGTLRAITVCIPHQRIAGTSFYRVPKSAVSFSGGATDYVVAECRSAS